MTIIITANHIQETLVTLYLRLNGFFVSGHIIHADISDPAIQEKGEIDTLAIRLPFGREPEACNPPTEYLGIKRGRIEIIIGEVKSGKEPIQFNPSLRDPDNICNVLLRTGFTEDDNLLMRISQSFAHQLIPKPFNSPNDHIEIYLEPSGDIRYPIRIRPTIFHLGFHSPTRNQAWFVGYDEIMNDIWHRVRKEFEPPSCQRQYDLRLWGPIFNTIVAYFKDPARDEPGTPDDILHDLFGDLEKNNNDGAVVDNF
jgi:hypothetical protein